ncbi:MAG: D-sedoheptulose 7-phosphate isomerase [Deltaproteobacteria bacterium]|nr:D-sedoheptulose 7-phosphate isomerase [Deltaproteobacteria bacterium]MCL5277788.1 D-sedoheptulose 7-phosphate isomerase [Deltaproteobacteria bacterium]
MDEIDVIKSELRSSAELKLRLMDTHAAVIQKAADIIHGAVTKGSVLFLFGNGGSAADAQHIAAEFVNRFKIERRPLPALALSTDTSVITSIGNDYSFDDIFSKQIAALGRMGDIAMGISTSGNSPNVVNAFKAARDRGLFTIGLLGRDGGRARTMVDLAVIIDHPDTPRIQEAHITIGHVLCSIIDQRIKNDGT